MERDAASAAPHPPPFDVVPPVAWETARGVGLAGAGLAAAAALLGVVAWALGDRSPWVISTARLLLVLVGAVTAGVGVSFRPDRWQIWLVGAATAGLAYFGTPGHWDSFRFLFLVLAGVALARVLLAVVPAGWRVGLVSAFLLFHFGGIFMATVSPPPTPWLVEQVYTRVYSPYLQFIYMRNAYHFYSPQPGPASLLACLIKTEVGEEVTATGERRKKYETRWVVLPRRPADIRDPMGLSYYRRLSLTDQISRVNADFFNRQSFERTEVQFRRQRLAQPGSEPFYPMHPDGSVLQYRLPDPVATRFLLPSYAQHVILHETPDADTAGRTTVKVYRIEHQTLPVEAFIGVTNPDRRPGSPYHPVTYYPFYLGEFDAHGRLTDPQADMLYWMLPVLPRAANGDPNAKDYDDYLSKHAGHEFDWSKLR